MKGWLAIGLICALSLLGSTARASEDAWRFLYEKDSVKVYDQKSELPTYKAEGMIAASMLDVLAVIADVPRRVEWVKGLKEAKLLEGKVGDLRVVIYERLDAPWPITDRESIVESKTSIDFVAGEASVAYVNVEKSVDFPPTDAVRIPHVKGLMKLKQLGPDQTLLSHEVSVDIGSALPNWAIKLFTREAPIETFALLAQQVLKTKGQYQEAVLQYQSQKPLP